MQCFWRAEGRSHPPIKPHSDAGAAEKVQALTRQLRDLSLNLGAAAGLGDLLWKIHEINVQISNASIEDKVRLAKTRRDLLAQAVAAATK